MIIHSHFGHNYSLKRVQAPRTESARVADQIEVKNSQKPSELEETYHSKNAETQRSQEEIQQLQKLRAHDRETRAHEQAHLAAAGGLARGGASFTYQRGPDGRLYAVGGEVKIDTSPVPGDPQATLEKARQIQRAALAPTEPSVQDRAVAAQAARMAVTARAELAKEQSDHEDQTPNNIPNSVEIDNESAIKNGLTNDEIHRTCAICGGKHGADAHSALTTYISHLPNRVHSGLGNRIQVNA